MTEPTPLHPRRHYTRRQKVTAVMAAEMTGIRTTAEAMSIPPSTVQYWFDDPDFAQYRAKTREEIAPEAIAIIHEALAMVRRKLDQFEPRDLSVLIGVLTDKAQLLTGEATSRNEHRELLAGFDDGEREAVADWLREVTRQRMTADANG